MKPTLIAAACLVVVAGVALVLMMSKGSEPSAKTTDPKAPAPQVAQQGGITATPAPSLGGSAAAPAGDNPHEYMIGDTKIRDHRSGSNAPLTIPPNPHPANGRAIPSELTHDITQQVRKVIYECAGAVPNDAKGTKPRVIGQLQVTIKDQKLSIKSMALDTADISDAAAATALTQCTQEKSAGFTSVAKDQADLDDYGIQLNFAIP